MPGAIWMSAAKTSGGLDADSCADDAGSGNAGAVAQVYQCNSDLAQSWTQASTGQLVRNGDCNFDEIVNSSSGQCLTAAKAVDFTQLTGAR